jgi:hypothetical protein
MVGDPDTVRRCRDRRWVGADRNRLLRLVRGRVDPNKAAFCAGSRRATARQEEGEKCGREDCQADSSRVREPEAPARLAEPEARGWPRSARRRSGTARQDPWRAPSTALPRAREASAAAPPGGHTGSQRRSRVGTAACPRGTRRAGSPAHRRLHVRRYRHRGSARERCNRSCRTGPARRCALHPRGWSVRNRRDRHALRVEEHVRGLDVAVDEPAPVGEIERVGHRALIPPMSRKAPTAIPAPIAAAPSRSRCRVWSPSASRRSRSRAGSRAEPGQGCTPDPASSPPARRSCSVGTRKAPCRG